MPLITFLGYAISSTLYTICQQGDVTQGVEAWVLLLF